MNECDVCEAVEINGEISHCDCGDCDCGEAVYEMSDVEADADTLASAGWGTDEDYGG
jgi:hypothetical protein